MRHYALLAGLSLSLLACAAQSSRAPSGLPARAIAERIAGAGAPLQSGPLVLAIVRASGQGQPQLVGHDLARDATRFRVGVDEAAQASLLGDVVWVRAADSVRALDAGDGHELYRLALPSGRYIGAARAGALIAFAVVNGRPLDPEARCTLLLVDAKTGRRSSALELPGDAGQPVAAGELVFVPSQRQRIIVIDAARGREVARLRAQSDAVEWLQVEPTGSGGRALVFGGGGFHRLVAGDAQPSASYRLPEALTALPGRPSAPPSAYEDHATRRIGLHITPVLRGASEVGLLADRAYFVFYTQLFAFDAQGALLFARSLPADAVAARVLPEGLLVVTAAGEIMLLSHVGGATLASQSLVSGGEPTSVRMAVLPPVAPQATAVEAGNAPSHEQLARALLELAGASDSRLVPARIYAVEQLSGMQDAFITGGLLALYEQPNTPAELQSAIASALSARKTGLGPLVSALERRYDFLAETKPAPLAVIAPALARAGEKSAVPGLLARFLDHETPATALASLARAIGTLGGAHEAAPLLEWLERYQADSSVRGEPEALLEAARAALALDPKRAKPVLARVTSAGRMASEPAQEIAALLEPKPAAIEEPLEVAHVEPAVAPKLPRLPAQRAIDQAFAAQLEAMKPCVEDELKANPKLFQLRIAFIAEGDGSAHGFHFAPASKALAECLYPKVAGIRVPAFAEPRSVEHVVINTRSSRDDEPAKDDGAREEPWWTWRAEAVREKTSDVPWWRVQQVVPPRLDESAGSALEIEAGARPQDLVKPTPTASSSASAPAAPPPASTSAATGAGGVNEGGEAPASGTQAQEPAGDKDGQDAWWVPEASP